MNQKDNLLGVLETLFKWSKSILYICAIALVGSVIISLMLTTYYQSTTIFFAASPDVAKPEQIFGTSTKDMEYYGNENDIDRILTIAESNELINFLIDKFSLYEHYDIDSTQLKAPDKVKKAFLKLYNIKKSKRDAIEISVEDEDPKLAAAIANTAREKINEIASRLIKASQSKLINTFDNNLKSREQQLNEMSDSLMRIRRQYGIYNTETQSESLASLSLKVNSKLAGTKARLQALKSNSSSVYRDTIMLLQASVTGLEKQTKDIDLSLEKFNNGMAKVDVLNRQHKESSLQLSEDKERYKQLKAAYNSEVSAIILVEKADIPVVKSRPMRSLIVIASVMIAFLFAVIGVLLLDTYKDVNWKKIINAK